MKPEDLLSTDSFVRLQISTARATEQANHLVGDLFFGLHGVDPSTPRTPGLIGRVGMARVHTTQMYVEDAIRVALWGAT